MTYKVKVLNYHFRIFSKLCFKDYPRPYSRSEKEWQFATILLEIRRYLSDQVRKKDGQEIYSVEIETFRIRRIQNGNYIN